VLRRKTRVLVTHGISFLPQVDQIVVMKEGKISEMGNYDQLMSNKGAFAEFLIEQLQQQENFDEDGEVEATAILSEAERDDIKAILEETLGKRDLKLKMAAKKDQQT
jgi:ATP-binding cassette subfamily C (CFTR/MRP) protein 1